MTFVVGLKCCDGIVVCTDSLEDDGITKKSVDKIEMVSGLGWGLAVAASGPGSTIDKFTSSLRTKLCHTPFDEQLIEIAIEQELTDFNAKYVLSRNDAFEVIIGIYATPLTRLLYKASCIEGQSVVLTPIRGDCHTGVGNELWRLLSDTLYKRGNWVADNARLAVFATRLAIRYASGVDEPIQIASYTSGDRFWRSYARAEIRAIEGEVSFPDFKESILRYWRLHNPPTTNEQLARYKVMRTPGDELTILEGVKLEELYTASGRRRASAIFRRNTDKLQQRANLVAKRYREAHPDA